MSNPEPTKAPPESSGPRIYDTTTPAKSTTTPRGVYDAPAARKSLPIGLIIGIVVALLVLAFLFFQFLT